VLASQTTLRIFALRVKDGPGKPLSVTLSLLRKVSNEITPDFIRLLPAKEGQVVRHEKSANKKLSADGVPDLLVLDKHGSMGILKSPPAAQLHSGSHFILVRGSLTEADADANIFTKKSAASSEVNMISACSVARILVIVTADGVPHLYNSTTGLEVKFSSPLNNVSAVVSTSKVFALGYECGRVAVFNAGSLSLLYLSPPLHDGCAKSTSITGLLLLNNSSCVVALRSSGEIVVIPSVFDARTSEESEIHVPQREVDASYHNPVSTLLLSCAGDSCMFGVLRFGAVLDVSRVVLGYDEAFSVQPVLYGLLRNFNESYSQDISLSTAHLVRNGNWLVVAAIGNVFDAPVTLPHDVTDAATADANDHRIVVTSSNLTSNLFVGSLNMLTATAIASRTSLQGKIPHIVVHQRICLASTASAWKHSMVCFEEKYCIVSTSNGLFVLDLLSASVAKSVVDCYGIPEHFVSWDDVNVGNHGDWSNCAVASCVAYGPQSDEEYSKSDNLQARRVESILDVASEGRSAYFPEVDVPSTETGQSDLGVDNQRSARLLNVYVRRNGQPPLLVRLTMKV
jgi:hypothetical protein